MKMIFFIMFLCNICFANNTKRSFYYDEVYKNETKRSLALDYSLVEFNNTGEKYCLKGVTSIPVAYCIQLQKEIKKVKSKNKVKIAFNDHIAKKTEDELTLINMNQYIKSIESEEDIGIYSIFSLKGSKLSYCLLHQTQEYYQKDTEGYGKFQRYVENRYSRDITTTIPLSYCKKIKSSLKKKNKAK